MCLTRGAPQEHNDRTTSAGCKRVIPLPATEYGPEVRSRVQRPRDYLAKAHAPFLPLSAFHQDPHTVHITSTTQQNATAPFVYAPSWTRRSKPRRSAEAFRSPSACPSICSTVIVYRARATCTRPCVHVTSRNARSRKHALLRLLRNTALLQQGTRITPTRALTLQPFKGAVVLDLGHVSAKTPCVKRSCFGLAASHTVRVRIIPCRAHATHG